MFAGGLLATLVLLTYDWLLRGKMGDFGPGQITALIFSFALTLIGLSLLPLGDERA